MNLYRSWEKDLVIARSAEDALAVYFNEGGEYHNMSYVQVPDDEVITIGVRTQTAGKWVQLVNTTLPYWSGLIANEGGFILSWLRGMCMPYESKTAKLSPAAISILATLIRRELDWVVPPTADPVERGVPADEVDAEAVQALLESGLVNVGVRIELVEELRM